MGPAKGPVVFGMAAVSAAFPAAGTLSGQNTTLCGTAPVLVQTTTSPGWMVMLAGSKRIPLASPIICTFTVTEGAGVELALCEVTTGGRAATMSPVSVATMATTGTFLERLIRRLLPFTSQYLY